MESASDNPARDGALLWRSMLREAEDRQGSVQFVSSFMFAPLVRHGANKDLLSVFVLFLSLLGLATASDAAYVETAVQC